MEQDFEARVKVRIAFCKHWLRVKLGELGFGIYDCVDIDLHDGCSAEGDLLQVFFDEGLDRKHLTRRPTYIGHERNCLRRPD